MKAFLVVLWVTAVALAAGGGPPSSVDTVVGKLQVELSLSKRAFAVGEPVETVITIRNKADQPMRVVFSSGQQFDLIIRRRGALVWRWSHDKAFTQALTEVNLRPNDPVTFRASWNQIDLQGRRVEPGEYEAVAAFLGQVGERRGVIETPEVAFRITK